MNEQLNTDLHNETAEIFRHHTTKKNAYIVVKKSLDLLKYTQQHRGINMAILDGDTFFRTLLPPIANKIEKLLIEIEDLVHSYDLGSSIEPFIQLKNEWKLVDRHWESLAILQNFEVHNHFVQNLMSFIRLVIENLEMIEIRKDIEELTEFVLYDLLNLVESLAQIRGLSSHIASSESNSGTLIQFHQSLIDSTKEKIDRAKLKINDHESFESQQILMHIGRNLCYQRAESFIKLIPDLINDGKPNLSKSQRCFSLGTEILNIYIEVLNSSIEILSQSLSPRLKSWIETPSRPLG